MPISDENSRLRKMNSELYTTDIQPPNKRSILHGNRVSAPDEWSDTGKKPLPASLAAQPKRTPRVFKTLFLGSFAFLAVAALVLGGSFLLGGNSISSNNVDIAITSKSFVDGGEELPVEVSIVNKNRLPLELATLVLEYPTGGEDAPGAVSRISRDIGTLAVGDTRTESFSLKLYGVQNSQKTITARLEFHVQGSNAIYDREEPATVTIRTSPANLALSVPSQVAPNQDVPLVFTVSGNGTATLPGTALVVQYPDGFSFAKADPSPSFGNGVWYLGDLPPGASRTVTVHGSFSGGSSDLKTFRASVGMQNPKNEQQLDTTYSTLAQVVPVSGTFMDARLAVSGDSANKTVAISAGQRVSMKVSWTNTLSVPVSNAQVTVRLSGSAYDPAKVEPVSGFFDTANNQLVWTRDQDPSLGSVNPGAKGDLSFSLVTKDSLSNVVNPQIVATVDVSGYRSGGTKLSAVAADTKTLVVNSDLSLLASTLHYTGSVSNSGPMPPVPNKETTYSLQLQVVNLRNRVSNVVVATTLPVYVSWKGVIVPQSEAANVTYNEVTRQLLWNVGEVPSGTGGNLPAKSVTMKVGITPSSSQSGAAPDLTGGITVTGRDGYTNQDLSVTRRPLTTQLLNDGTGAGSSGLVGGK